MTTPEERLESLGIELPSAPPPAASYVPWTQTGSLVFTAGQIPVRDGVPISTGRLGDELSLEDGQAAARQCGINVLAQLKSAAGELSRVRRLVKITVFVASTSDFHSQHLVANGASDLLGEVLGDVAGPHARSAVGVAVLPMNVGVEVEAVAELA
jgi:enamine deaminase RidA (YjgF/YER057c/UK114 family)